MLNLSRRGLFGILAAGIAPAVITTPGLLMPVNPILVTPVWRIQPAFVRCDGAVVLTIYGQDYAGVPVNETFRITNGMQRTYNSFSGITRVECESLFNDSNPRVTHGLDSVPIPIESIQTHVFSDSFMDVKNNPWGSAIIVPDKHAFFHVGYDRPGDA